MNLILAFALSTTAQLSSITVIDSQGLPQVITVNSNQMLITYFQDPKIKACFNGDAQDLVNNINHSGYNESDWGLIDAKKIDEDKIAFSYFDLASPGNDFLINRCSNN